jgi:hypothetical protein
MIALERSIRSLCVLVVLLLGAGGSATAQQLQLGLRLDSRSAMQWTGDTLLVKGAVQSFTRLPVGRIEEVWVGPRPGTFGVVSPEGVAMLLGTTTVPGGIVVESGELLRSSRPDVVWACVSLGVTPRRRIVEVRRGRHVRDLITFDQTVTDFDVDVAGRVAALLADGRLVLAWGPATRQEVSAPALRQALGGLEARRVFLDASGRELAVYAGAVRARLDITRGTWSAAPFDPTRGALVRHAVSRRMRVEERWRLP